MSERELAKLQFVYLQQPVLLPRIHECLRLEVLCILQPTTPATNSAIFVVANLSSRKLHVLYKRGVVMWERELTEVQFVNSWQHYGKI